MACSHPSTHARLMGAVPHKRTETSVHTDPPEPPAPEGFFVVLRSGLEICARHVPGRETRIPGHSHRTGCERPKRGARRRERREHTRGPPMAGRMKDPLWRRAIPVRAPRRQCVFPFLSLPRVSRLTYPRGEGFGFLV